MAKTSADVIPLRRRPPRVVEGHPSLRWMAGDVYWLAHRRDPETRRPLCGAEGDLVLAIDAVPLCGGCFPAARVEGAS